MKIFDFFPIDNFPPRVEILTTIMKEVVIVSMFPEINNEKWSDSLSFDQRDVIEGIDYF
jgi:hypothetical protein